MSAPSMAQLRILVDRSARGLTPAEQGRLREGMEALSESERLRGMLAATVAALPDAHDAANLAHARTQRDLNSRALSRAHALAGDWQGDQTSITRAEAAVLLMEVIQLHGWTQTDARPALAAVGPSGGLSAHRSAVPADSGAEAVRDSQGASGGDRATSGGAAP